MVVQKVSRIIVVTVVVGTVIVLWIVSWFIFIVIIRWGIFLFIVFQLSLVDVVAALGRALLVVIARLVIAGLRLIVARLVVAVTRSWGSSVWLPVWLLLVAFVEVAGMFLLDESVRSILCLRLESRASVVRIAGTLKGGPFNLLVRTGRTCSCAIAIAKLTTIVERSIVIELPALVRWVEIPPVRLG